MGTRCCPAESEATLSAHLLRGEEDGGLVPLPAGQGRAGPGRAGPAGPEGSSPRVRGAAAGADGPHRDAEYLGRKLYVPARPLGLGRGRVAVELGWRLDRRTIRPRDEGAARVNTSARPGPAEP